MIKEKFTVNRKFVLGAVLITASLIILNGFTFFLFQEEIKKAEKVKNELTALQQQNKELKASLACEEEKFAELLEDYNQLLEEKEDRERRLPERGLKEEKAPTAYLTFDDGPSKNTLAILDILAEYGVTATFFPIGANTSGDENIYLRIVEEGHALGNHTYTHNLKTIYRSANAFMADLLRLEEVIYEQTGMRPDMVRFPGGSSNKVASPVVMKEIIDTLRSSGYDYFDWNIYPDDNNYALSPDDIVERVLDQMDRMPGKDVVILLHDSWLNYKTVEALPQIIEGIEARSYRFALLHKDAIAIKHR